MIYSKDVENVVVHLILIYIKIKYICLLNKRATVWHYDPTILYFHLEYNDRHGK